MGLNRLLLFAALGVTVAIPPNIIFLQSDSFDGRLMDQVRPVVPSLLSPVSRASTLFIQTDATMYYKLILGELRNDFISKGTTFARHYCNSPQCVPSRTSMVTGRYVHESLTPNNGQGLALSTKTGALDENCISNWNERWCSEIAQKQNISATLIDMMAGAGYELALFGRFDIGAGILQDYPGTTGDGWVRTAFDARRFRSHVADLVLCFQHDGPELGILARGAALVGAMDSGPWNSTDENANDPFAADQAKANEVRGTLLQRRCPSTVTVTSEPLDRCTHGLQTTRPTLPCPQRRHGSCGWGSMHRIRPTRWAPPLS